LKTKILITAGDPLGVGPEITARAVASKALAALDITVIGDAGALEASGFKPGPASLISVPSSRAARGARRPRAETGLASFQAVELALDLLERGRYGALVTAPVSKEAWKLAGITHAGHTDLFRERTGLEPLMGFSAGKIRTALVTEHLPIKLLPARITARLVVEKALLFAGALRSCGVRAPRIALAALNPHAGDGGLLGGEEASALAPAVSRLRRAGVDIRGPISADSAWREHVKGLSDGLLCLYHDQALAPLKVLPEAAGAVHWTWGLPFVRTSPAHGTAFDIAGRGKADPTGMISAILFAAEAAKRKE